MTTLEPDTTCTGKKKNTISWNSENDMIYLEFLKGQVESSPEEICIPKFNNKI